MHMVDYRLVDNEWKYWGFIRGLRNDPEIQDGFIEQVNISISEQSHYMSKYGHKYYICLNSNDEPLGYIGEIEDDIRLAVTKYAQRQGVGSFMIRELMRLRPNSKAKVLKYNKASNKLFLSCGFKQTNETKDFYHYELQIS